MSSIWMVNTMIPPGPGAAGPIAPAELSHLRALAHGIGAGREELEVLQHRRRDVLTVRAPRRDGDSVVMKLWDHRGWRGATRRLTGTAAASREWRAMCRLHRSGVAVAVPLARLFLDPARAGYTHALVMSDLGRRPRGSEHLAALLAAGSFQAAGDFEDAVIELTAGMIDAGVMDVDHSLMNVVVGETGGPVRLDLELTRCVRQPAQHRGLYGAMLGRLIGSYVFAVHPGLDRVPGFADRLAARLAPSRGVRRRARRSVQRLTARQRREASLGIADLLAW